MASQIWAQTFPGPAPQPPHRGNRLLPSGVSPISTHLHPKIPGRSLGYRQSQSNILSQPGLQPPALNERGPGLVRLPRCLSIESAPILGRAMNSFSSKACRLWGNSQLEAPSIMHCRGTFELSQAPDTAVFQSALVRWGVREASGSGYWTL